jgi:hypothetical protein
MGYETAHNSSVQFLQAAHFSCAAQTRFARLNPVKAISKTIALKLCAKLRGTRELRWTMWAMQAMPRGFLVAILGTFGGLISRRQTNAGTGTARLFLAQCGATSIGQPTRMISAPVEDDLQPQLSVARKTSAVDICLWSKHYPTQCIARIQIHQDGALSVFVLLAGLYPVVAGTADGPS